MPERKPKAVGKRIKALSAKPVRSRRAGEVKGGAIKGDKADAKTGVANITKKA